MSSSVFGSRRDFLWQATVLIAGSAVSASAFGQAQETGWPVFYPLHAIQTKIEGTAKVYAEIAKGGYAETVRLETSSGQTILDQAAEGAVALWVFKRNLPAEKRQIVVPLEFKLTKATEKDLPKKNADGKFPKRMAKVFFPYNAQERGLQGTCEVLAELSTDGFAEKVSIEKANKSQILNQASLMFTLVSSFGPKLAGKEGQHHTVRLPWDYKI